jgi:hypothetical protein
MPTGLSFNYAHAWDSMTKGIDSNGPYYSVSYYFDDWSVSDQVVNELMGITQRTGESTIRTGPHQHPLSPNLCCADVQLEGMGVPVLNSQGVPNYSGGFFAHCTYRVPPYQQYQTQDPANNHQIDPDNPILWCTQELDFDTEVYISETAKYIWETDSGIDPLDGKRTDVPVKVTLGVTTMTLTYHRLPYLPMGMVRTLRNKVNSSTFMGVAAGKLLFLGGKTTREINNDGEITQRVTLVFKERDQDWRKFLRPDEIGWAKIKDASSNYVFSSADLSPLGLL